MDSGWVKVYRKLLDNPVVCKDADHIAVWVLMLLSATHTPQQVLFGGNVITLQPGQFVSGRKAISNKVKVEESKVNRIIKFFKSQQLIEQQTSTKNSLFTILNWSEYQESEQQNEQQVNNNCTTSEHKQECKNERMKEIDILFDSLWQLYPNKKGKGQVSAARKKAVYRVGYDEMKRAIDRYKKDLEKDKWRKPQNGSTFFNSGYIDYLDDNYTKGDTEDDDLFGNLL